MESKVYHHILYININNRVLSHDIEDSNEDIRPGTEAAYVTTYNRSNQVFRVSYYTYDSSKFTVRDYVIQTFRSHCKPEDSGINNFAI